jgi:hypothetical protein
LESLVTNPDDTNLLFRITSFRHVIDMFEAKHLQLSHPSAWDDPYERLVEHARQESVFAQCWSKRETSDAIWRIYSPDRMGLSIRTTRSPLAQALEEANATTPIQYFVMEVKYLAEAAAVERANVLVHDAESAGQTVRGVMASLLVKRAAFDHEAEVRVIVHLLGDSPYGGAGPMLRLPIDPHRLVDQIVFDPRADPVLMRMCTHYLRNSLNYKGEITRSRLYDKSEYMIVV